MSSEDDQKKVKDKIDREAARLMEMLNLDSIAIGCTFSRPGVGTIAARTFYGNWYANFGCLTEILKRAEQEMIEQSPSEDKE